jgi:hypothetical protein
MHGEEAYLHTGGVDAVPEPESGKGGVVAPAPSPAR